MIPSADTVHLTIAIGVDELEQLRVEAEEIFGNRRSVGRVIRGYVRRGMNLPRQLEIREAKPATRVLAPLVRKPSDEQKLATRTALRAIHLLLRDAASRNDDVQKLVDLAFGQPAAFDELVDRAYVQARICRDRARLVVGDVVIVQGAGLPRIATVLELEDARAVVRYTDGDGTPAVVMRQQLTLEVRR